MKLLGSFTGNVVLLDSSKLVKIHVNLIFNMDSNEHVLALNCVDNLIDIYKFLIYIS